MNKRKLHHKLVVLRRVPLWSFLVVGLVFLLIAVLALRQNNQNMIELREAVFAADEKNADVEGALKDLREYVYGHMNTNLAAGDNAIKPPIQLKHRYDRLVEAEQAKLQSSNGNLYTDAQNYCEANQPGGFSGSNRLDCIRQYLDSHGAADVAPVYIPDDLYKFDFVSPAWSPDLAGWSLVLAAVLLSLFVVRLVVEQAIRLQLKD